MTPTIRRATRADAAALAHLAAATFVDTYAAHNDPADMAAHLSAKYSEATQARELADPSATYLVAEVDGNLAGYAFLLADRMPPGMSMPTPVELLRFYVTREWHGRGVARALMDACVDEAARRGARTLWLSVWQRNPRAIAFYRKCGFTAVGATAFQLGSQQQDDDVMARPVDAPTTG